MRPTTYDAFWCARSTAWVGFFLVVLGGLFALNHRAALALACFVPASLAFAGAAIVNLWARRQKADEDARITRTLDLIGKSDTVAAQRLREIRDEMLATPVPKVEPLEPWPDPPAPTIKRTGARAQINGKEIPVASVEDIEHE